MSETTISVVVNGRPGEFPANATLLDLLETMGGARAGVAVAVNDEVVRRELLPTVKLKPGDKVEVIQAVGGG